MNNAFNENIVSILLIVFASFSISSFTNFLFVKFKNFEKKSEKKIEELSDFEYQNSDISIDRNEKQYQLLRQYHSQGLLQSKVSFWFSIVFGVIGFIIITTSIFKIEIGKPLGFQTNSIISLVSGIVIDTVSALFFVQSNKSRELMAAFFDKLRADRKIDESLKLADEINDVEIKSKLKVILSLHFSEICINENIIETIYKDSNEITKKNRKKTF